MSEQQVAMSLYTDLSFQLVAETNISISQNAQQCGKCMQKQQVATSLFCTQLQDCQRVMRQNDSNL